MFPCALLAIACSPPPSQVGGDLDPELEELFDDLHDSGDLDLAVNKAQKRAEKAAAGVCCAFKAVFCACVCACAAVWIWPSTKPKRRQIKQLQVCSFMTVFCVHTRVCLPATAGTWIWPSTKPKRGQKRQQQVCSFMTVFCVHARVCLPARQRGLGSGHQQSSEEGRKGSCRCVLRLEGCVSALLDTSCIFVLCVSRVIST